MARSIRIPWLIDLKRIEDKGEIATLSLDTRIDRAFKPRGALINRFLARRVANTLSLDGKPLPSVAARTDAERIATQEALKARLDPANGPLWDEESVAALAAAVRNDDDAREIGPVTQQAVGRLFVPDYVGDTESWNAARDLDDAVRSRNPFRLIQLYATGRLRRSRKLLARRVNGDLAGVHASGIAVHNLVQGFRAMRDLWRRPGPRPSPDEVVGRCLFAPPRVLRQAKVHGGTLAGIVRPGTLLLYRLDKASALKPGDDSIFMSGTWASCPASGAVPALLRAVWERALAGKPAETPP
jgi:hypothetical protein